MKIVIFSHFPKEVRSFILKGVIKRAFDDGIFSLECLDWKSFGIDPSYTVDDRPFGGGPGMLLKPDVLTKGIESIKFYENYNILIPCPKGYPIKQSLIKKWINSIFDGIIILSGAFEGVDARIYQLFPNAIPVSLGDIVLTSGDIPSISIVNACVRSLPGTLRNSQSSKQDSISTGRLEEDQFTRPRKYREVSVPDVLLEGHHQKVSEWRSENSLKKTLLNRFDLFLDYPVNDVEKKILTKILLSYEGVAHE